MKLIDQTLYIEFTELIAAGINEGTIKQANQRNSNGWNFIKDPADNRKLLLQYDTLPEFYKEKLQLKYGKNPALHLVNAAIKHHLNSDEKALNYYRTCIKANGEKLTDKHIKEYTKAANWLNLIIELTSPASKEILKSLNLTKEGFWKAIGLLLESEQVKLPTAYDPLRKKVKHYQATGYACIVPKSQGNTNSQKICDEAGRWLIAQYGLGTMQTPMLWMKYNQEATKQGWCQLKSEQAVYLYLNKPENKRLWFMARHGEKKAKEVYGYMVKTTLPTFRDALWYSDGTKLNYYYRDANNKVRADLKVYEVIDTYSECMLGYSIDYSEDFVAQYTAFKMACQFSGHKAVELRTDNQGGHKKLGGFLDSLADIGFKCQPYNGKSKTIESIFGRMQSQFMRQDWFYTGANIQAKSLDSKADIDFILKNKAALPDEEGAREAYKIRRDEWNMAPHPQYGKPRIQVYYESVNPNPKPLDALDMVEMFWLEKRGPDGKGIAYHNFGLTIEFKKEKYEYEVLNENGMPDQAMREKLIDQKFVVKYDPSDLTLIRLYKDTPTGLQYVTHLEPRLENPRATIDYKPGDRKRLNELLQLRKDEMSKQKVDIEEVGYQTGIHKEDLVYGKGATDFYKQASNATVGVEAGEPDMYDLM